ncbi:MAG TPA: porin [Steroidobacteraceae bacterium]|nr:porin [Steroidobacteraceae bacterium]
MATPVRTSGAALVAALISCPALAAGDPAIEQQLNVLQQALAKQQEQLQQQQQQLQTQAQEIARLREQLAASPATGSSTEQLASEVHQAKLAAQDAPRVTLTNARPSITSADGRASFSPRAVVQLDAANYGDRTDGGAGDFRRGSVGATANRETAAARDFSEGAYFRRARFGFEGTVARDFTYRVLAELGGSGTEGPARINDFWIGYTGFAPFTIQVGAFSPPANMDDGINVESSLFIERATPSELSRTLGGADGRIGIGARGNGSRWMSSVTLTSRTVNDAEVFDSQLAAVGRFGALLATSADYNLHAGVSGTWVIHPPDQGSTAAVTQRRVVRLRDRPEIRVDSTRLIDTGSIDADSAYVYGLEAGANWKNWYLQAESFRYGIERSPATGTLPDPTFDGFYVQGSWILSGESRRYDIATGAFQAPRPFVPFTSAGGRGAWELALRFSRMDLDFHSGLAGTAATADAIRGGTQDIWTFGVNWYVNANVKLMLNWLHVDVDRLNPAGVGNLTPFGPAPGTPPIGVQIGQDLDIFGLRTQYAF